MSLSRLIQRAILAAAVFLGLAAGAHAQAVLVFDGQRVLTQSAVGQYIATQLQPIAQSIQSELQPQADQLAQQQQQLTVELESLTPEALQQRPDLQQRAQQFNLQGQQFSQLQQQRQQELALTENQAFEPVVAVIDEIVEQIRAERQAALVLQQLPYAYDPNADITQEVINRLNQRMTTTPVTRVTLPAQQQQQPAQ